MLTMVVLCYVSCGFKTVFVCFFAAVLCFFVFWALVFVPSMFF